MQQTVVPLYCPLSNAWRINASKGLCEFHPVGEPCDISGFSSQSHAAQLMPGFVKCIEFRKSVEAHWITLNSAYAIRRTVQSVTPQKEIPLLPPSSLFL